MNLPPTIARCSLGHVGLVTGYRNVIYDDGSIAMAHTGYHLWPLRFFGKPWSSRSARWIWRVLYFRTPLAHYLDIYTPGKVHCYSRDRLGRSDP